MKGDSLSPKPFIVDCLTSVLQECMTEGMETPVFALRLPQKLQDDLAEYSVLYGAPNPRAFAKEILEVVLSGDPRRVAEFNGRLMQKIGEQMTFETTLKALSDAKEATEKAKRAHAPRKGAAHRAKRS